MDWIRYTQHYNIKIVEENSLSFDGQIFNNYLKLLEKHEDEQQHLDYYKEPVISASAIRTCLIDDGRKEEGLTATKIGRRLKAMLYFYLYGARDDQHKPYI